ncbi:dienelactone hydrolase [Dothidotthia symphoricarpi CBS 119687]|uniref:Dienelactone hydrolase n=1 Tax=Dothidotthia symphoricarpi CBS 119687 TaxID=1392245 RepID=A0A6A5ZYD7_9PLEO|nr:dienelactone hydrolase [Dothidotthia symphoricarpi CBS 119687]KAF2123388.1 dienelactone hydrolase [Dothidotthia symphoricarpi CBS 119687]
MSSWDLDKDSSDGWYKNLLQSPRNALFCNAAFPNYPNNTRQQFHSSTQPHRVSNMSSTSPKSTGNRFLSFEKNPPRIWLTALSPHAPEKALLSWQDEGFDVRYLPYDSADQADFIRTIKNLHVDLKLGEHYAIVAYGEAASMVLKAAFKPMVKCCAIVAYYPPLLPSPNFKYPDSLQLQMHLAGLKQDDYPHPDLCKWKFYRYDDCTTGFADPSSRTYSDVEANLAWSRALACVRKGFNEDVDLEPVVRSFWEAKYEDDLPERGSMSVVKNMTQNSPHVTILPTLEGGVGRKNLQEFYREFFIPSLVEDFKIRLVSRTIGVDRVVDEMVVSFTHSDEIDWILPGVPPTDKYVEIPVVSIVAIKGGKLVSEHMYYDAASVLMQVGLLDPKNVPKNFRNQGLKRLPVTGVEAAKQLVEPRQERYNGLLQEHGLMDGLNGSNK